MTHTGGLEPGATTPPVIRVRVMTPMVFWASLVPCASETSPAEAICPARYPLAAVRSPACRPIRYVSRVAAIAAIPATSGDISAGSRTLTTTASPCTPCSPTAASVAPIRPPNSACEELDGRPASQVTRFQTIAPMRPAKITCGRMPDFSSMIPPEIVLATWTDKKAPARLSTADIATAALGPRAPVEMVVAMALAVSWKPFVKSNTSAVAITTPMSSVMCSIHPSIF